MPATARTIDFGHGNQRAELPLLEPTLGPPMIDTRRLREETGCWAYDPSFGATGACHSAITFTSTPRSIARVMNIRRNDRWLYCGRFSRRQAFAIA